MLPTPGTGSGVDGDVLAAARPSLGCCLLPSRIYQSQLRAGGKDEAVAIQRQMLSWISLAGEAVPASATVMARAVTARAWGESQSSVPASLTQSKGARLSAS